MKSQLLDIQIEFIRNTLIPSLSDEKYLAICDSCGIQAAGKNGKYELVLAWGNSPNGQISDLETLRQHCETGGKWLFGILGYDLKNQLDKPTGSGTNFSALPPLSFFIPEHVLTVDFQGVVMLYGDSISLEDLKISANHEKEINPIMPDVAWNARTSKSKYLERIDQIQEAIRSGDIYELNYCQEFYSLEFHLADPLALYRKLTVINPSPFSCYFRSDMHYLISSSPERFMQRNGDKILCQPMKGTIARSPDEMEDQLAISSLRNSEKDRSENVMIVDLVRNDLAQNCTSGTIKVDELFGVYSFQKVHQMISTVSALERSGLPRLQVLLDCFPMGSMTGAPKYSVIEHIDKFEDQARGWYSGSFGYIDPNGDFDFNVVIRSFLYNATSGYISVSAGGAITIDSNAFQEYEESLLKAESLLKLLSPAWSPLQDR